MRKLIIDTETTGLSHAKGDKIIEIAMVEMIGRELTGNNFHSYVNPGRDIPEFVTKIHGITNEKVAAWPKIEEIKDDIIEYVMYGHENPPIVIAHNADFDIGFIRAELNLFHKTEIICTKKLQMQMDKAKPFSKGYKLDDLIKRYNINMEREFHGALLDANILAQVYLQMTKDEMVNE